MALSKGALKAKIVKEMQGKGMVTEGEFARAADLAEAIANAVIDEITSSGVVTVTAGSSAGVYSIS